jgi:WD40 repeat protein
MGKPRGDPLTGHTNQVTSVTFSADGQTLASGSLDRTIILWDMTKGQPINDLPTSHTNEITSLAFSPDGQLLASASCSDEGVSDCIEGEIILWDVAEGKPIGEPLTEHRSAITSLLFSADGQTLASNSADGAIILWNVAKFDSMWGSNPGSAAVVSFSPDGQTLALASCSWAPTPVSLFPNCESIIMFWNLAIHQPIGDPLQFKDFRSAIPGGDEESQGDDKERLHAFTSLAFSPDWQTLAWGSVYDGIILLDMTTRQPVCDPIPAGNHSLEFSPDGQTLAVASPNGTITLLDVATCQPLGDEFGGSGGFSDMALSPDGQTFALSNVARIILWDVATDNRISGSLRGHTDWVISLVFSPDGQMLASGSQDRTIILWDVATQQPVGDPLRIHKDSVNSLAFSPDGQMLASGGWEEIILWDVETRQPIGKYQRGGSVVFSPDGQMLALKSSGEIILLDISVDSWKARACRAAGRNMSLNEWQQYMGSEQPYAKTCPDLPIHSDVFVQEGLQLLEAGAVISATQQFSAALQQNPIFDIVPDRLNTLCLSGSLQGYADKVLFACDRMVAQVPESLDFHDSRGLARALTHDYAGAIEDFTFFVEHYAPNSYYPSPSSPSMPIDERLAQRRAWIAALERGENPLTDEVLRELRGEE